jgi:tetratricopeptide (TPR) repeat protein
MRNLARSYITGNEPEKAIELLNEGLALIDSTGQDEILGDFHLFRGIAYNQTGNHTGALDDYKNAIAHIKTYPLRIVPPSYYFHLARGYRHLGSDSAYVYAREFIDSNNRYRENIRLSAGLRAGFMSRLLISTMKLHAGTLKTCRMWYRRTTSSSRHVREPLPKVWRMRPQTSAQTSTLPFWLN